MKCISISFYNHKYLVFENGKKFKIDCDCNLGHFLYDNAEKVRGIDKSMEQLDSAMKNKSGFIKVLLDYGSVDFVNDVPDVVKKDIETIVYLKDSQNPNYYID